MSARNLVAIVNPPPPLQPPTPAPLPLRLFTVAQAANQSRRLHLKLRLCPFPVGPEAVLSTGSPLCQIRAGVEQEVLQEQEQEVLLAVKPPPPPAPTSDPAQFHNDKMQFQTD